jgi:chaperonin GroES
LRKIVHFFYTFVQKTDISPAKKEGDEFMAQQAVKKLVLKPLGNRVLVQRLEQEEKMKGGIILPDTAKKKQERAKVVAVGSGKQLDDGKLLPIPVQVGDLVLMDKYSGQEVTIDDEEFVIVKADDLIAKIEE